MTLPRITQLDSSDLGAEGDAGHLDGVLGAARHRHRAHERLVAVAQVGVHHVEVALVDRHVDRLAHRAARVVQPRHRPGQLDEVLEVGERAVAAPAGEVAHERRAVGRGEHDGVAADLDRVRRVAGDLGERRRRGRAQRPHVPGVEAHPLPVDGRAGVGEQPQGDVVVDLDADLGEQLVGLGLDQGQPLLADQLVGGICRRMNAGADGVAAGAGARLEPGRAAAVPGRAIRPRGCGRAPRPGGGSGCGGPSSSSTTGGSITSHVPSMNRWQRVWNTHPDGGLAGLGISPLEADAPRRLAVDARHRRQQRLGVRVVRTVEDLVGRADLLDPPEVHHDDAVGEVAHDAEVVADEQVARRLRRLQVGQQVEDRRLHRHVERARRLVAHDDARVAGERPGDRHALLQPARELTRPHVEVPRREAQRLGQLLDPLVGGLALDAGQLGAPSA